MAFDVEDFDASLAVTQRLNDDRHLEATAIHANIDINSSLLSTNEAVSWELRMDITVTHSTNGTYYQVHIWYAKLNHAKLCKANLRLVSLIMFGTEEYKAFLLVSKKRNPVANVIETPLQWAQGNSFLKTELVDLV